jgi:hypothetical protein
MLTFPFIFELLFGLLTSLWANWSGLGPKENRKRHQERGHYSSAYLRQQFKAVGLQRPYLQKKEFGARTHRFNLKHELVSRYRVQNHMAH